MKPRLKKSYNVTPSKFNSKKCRLVCKVVTAVWLLLIVLSVYWTTSWHHDADKLARRGDHHNLVKRSVDGDLLHRIRAVESDLDVMHEAEAMLRDELFDLVQSNAELNAHLEELEKLRDEKAKLAAGDATPTRRLDGRQYEEARVGGDVAVRTAPYDAEFEPKPTKYNSKVLEIEFNPLKRVNAPKASRSAAAAAAAAAGSPASPSLADLYSASNGTMIVNTQQNPLAARGYDSVESSPLMFITGLPRSGLFFVRELIASSTANVTAMHWRDQRTARNRIDPTMCLLRSHTLGRSKERRRLLKVGTVLGFTEHWRWPNNTAYCEASPHFASVWSDAVLSHFEHRHITVLVVRRSLVDTVRSIVAHGWFGNERERDPKCRDMLYDARRDRISLLRDQLSAVGDQTQLDDAILFAIDVVAKLHRVRAKFAKATNIRIVDVDFERLRNDDELVDYEPDARTEYAIDVLASLGYEPTRHTDRVLSRHASYWHTHATARRAFAKVYSQELPPSTVRQRFEELLDAVFDSTLDNDSEMLREIRSLL